MDLELNSLQAIKPNQPTNQPTNLTNYQSKTIKTYQALVEKQGKLLYMGTPVLAD